MSGFFFFQVFHLILLDESFLNLLPFSDAINAEIGASRAAVDAGWIDKPGKETVPLNEVMDMSARMTPVLVADFDVTIGEVFNVTLNSKNQYGITPQPMF